MAREVDGMSLIERYPKRIRIDRTTDTDRLLGPFSADRTNGRSDMDSCIYVRADLHRRAVEERRILSHALSLALKDHVRDVSAAKDMYIKRAGDDLAPRGGQSS